MTDIAPAQWFPTKTKIIDDDADSDINMAVYLHRIEEEEYDAELARALALSKQTAEWEAWARASPMSTASSTIAISRTASTAVSTASLTAVLPIPNSRTEPGYEFNRLSSISSDLDDDAISISSLAVFHDARGKNAVTTGARRLSLRDREERPPDVELLLYRGVFINSRRCTVCRNRMKQPTSGNETGRLHFSCSHYKATHCRGCGSLIHCPQNPSERHSCLIPQNCCSQIRAVAIYEALSPLDDSMNDTDSFRSRHPTMQLHPSIKCLLIMLHLPHASSRAGGHRRQ
ncbi:hypothetical protein C8J56DRAFT_1168408 [Mycena floridula]|nr:hypothetical protein C8J56DRAFT_1168408 [Mycena floridula]